MRRDLASLRRHYDDVEDPVGSLLDGGDWTEKNASICERSCTMGAGGKEATKRRP